MTLLEECLTALEGNALVLSKEESKKIFDNFIKSIPMTPWGTIDWKNTKQVKRILSINNLKHHIPLNKNEVYILWNEESLPAIKTNIDNVLKVIYDITAVSFDTWIFCPKNKYVIEFYHENEVHIGFY